MTTITRSQKLSQLFATLPCVLQEDIVLRIAKSKFDKVLAKLRLPYTPSLNCKGRVVEIPHRVISVKGKHSYLNTNRCDKDSENKPTDTKLLREYGKCFSCFYKDGGVVCENCLQDGRINVLTDHYYGHCSCGICGETLMCPCEVYDEEEDDMDQDNIFYRDCPDCIYYHNKD